MSGAAADHGHQIAMTTMPSTAAGSIASMKRPSRDIATRMPKARASIRKTYASVPSAARMPKAPITREPIASPKPIAGEHTRRHRWLRILLESADEAEQQDRHRDREWPILGVHEHVADIEWAGRQQDKRKEARARSADSPAGAPHHQQSDNPDQRASQPPGFEQRERENFCGKRCDQVEPAAIHVEVDPGERALIAEPGSKEGYQEVAVFGVRVVVPAEPVIAERKQRDNGCNGQHSDGEAVVERWRPSEAARAT